jgi:Spy/CpxP family protein refolding chaperone
MEVDMRATRHQAAGIAVLLAFLIVAIVPALAQNGNPAQNGGPTFQFGPRPPGSFGAGPGGLALERLDRQLAFSDAQKAQIQALIAQQRTDLKAAVDNLLQTEQALGSAIMQIPEDDNLLQAQVTAVSTVQAQIALARAQTEAKIYQLLTPDQQQKAQQWIAQMQQRLQQRSGQSGQ